MVIASSWLPLSSAGTIVIRVAESDCNSRDMASVAKSEKSELVSVIGAGEVEMEVVVDLLEPVGRDDPREEETFALAEAWGLGFRWEGTSFLDCTRRSWMRRSSSNEPGSHVDDLLNCRGVDLSHVSLAFRIWYLYDHILRIPRLLRLWLGRGFGRITS